jgi:hypothetical protein
VIRSLKNYSLVLLCSIVIFKPITELVHVDEFKIMKFCIHVLMTD